MSILSWNCSGLGHPRTVQVLVDLVKSKKPSFLFLIETLSCRSSLESIKAKLGFDGFFVVDWVGRSGGLALRWKASSKVSLLSCARNFIDVEVEVAGLGKWRMTGYYGYLESSR